MKTLRTYLDARLLLFLALAIGASVISSHGAYQFFLYLVDDWLAAVFIGVVALGIIGLDAAGTLERGWRRAPYYVGMGVFLLLETLANYFAGQAGFVARIVAKLPPSSDLRTIAEQHPAVTRLLVVLFLAMASIAVALFTFAAATRFGQIRAGQTDRLGRILARLRRRYSAVVGMLHAARKELAQAAADLQARVQELAQARAQSALLDVELQREREAVAQVRARVRTFAARIRAKYAQSLRQRRALSDLVESLRVERDSEWHRAENLRAALDERAEQSAADAEQFRTWADAQVQKSAATLEGLRIERDELGAKNDQLRTQLDHLRAELGAVRTVQQQAQAELTEAQGIAAQLRTELDEARAMSALDVKGIAQAMRDEGVPLRTIGEVLNVSEKTIRNWTTAPMRLKEVA